MYLQLSFIWHQHRLHMRTHRSNGHQRNATQRNVNGLVLVDGSPGANGGPSENGGTAGLEAQGKTAVAEGMVGMEMVPVTVEMAVAMEEMVEMAGTDETRYVAQM